MVNHEYRVQRGRILKILYRAYKDPVHGGNIALTLDDMRLSTSRGILMAHIQYLEDRGLLVVERGEAAKRHEDDFSARLTWQGVDFVERDVSDDGIELGV